jgi:SHAQKYF class myb-like DNA-binding protein
MPKDHNPDADADPDPSDVDEGNASPNTHPVPPPFNPIGPPEQLPVAVLSSSAAEAAVLAAKGASVVPDLMRVYESLTQRSTPQQNDLAYMDSTNDMNENGNTADVDAAQAQGQYSVYHPYDMRPDPPLQQQQQQQQQQQPLEPQFGAGGGGGYAQAWTYDTTSVPVAVVGNVNVGVNVPQYGENPFVPSTMPVPASVNVHQGAGAPPAASVVPSSTAETGSARSLRKRTAATSFANNNGNSNSNNSVNNSNRDDSSSASIGDNTSTTRGSKAQRRKGKDSDGRWSKRFTWPEDLHRDFVSAVFDVGLKHSSPSTILEHMPKHEQITSERIKSHLQKYRLHRAKSKKEFMASYESAVTKIQTEGLASVTSLGGAQVPAHLTYVTMTETSGGGGGGMDATKPQQVQLQSQQLQQQAQRPPQLQPILPLPQGAQAPATTAATTDEPKAAATQQQQEALMLPRLSEAEKASPIGASMGYLMGLFFSLKQQLVAQRAIAAAAAAADAAKKNQPVAAVFDAFVSGNLPSTGDLVAVMNPDGTNVDKVLSPPNAVPSARSNLEENNMMKREMKNQMAFQNKMRALKMQELKKLKTVGGDEVNVHKEEDGSVLHLANAVSTAAAITANSKAVAFDSTNEQHGDPDQLQPQPLQHLSSQQQLNDHDQQHQEFQGAGEAAADDGGVMFEGERNRSMSIGASEDFWNTDVVDDQLFEFLMNN